MHEPAGHLKVHFFHHCLMPYPFMVISIFRSCSYIIKCLQVIVNIKLKAMDRQILDQIRANDIPDKEIEENREKRPTREDVRRLLSEKEGKIFFLQITFNAKRGKTLDYTDIYEHLYKRYRLYKLRSSITDGKTESHTLSPSTYIAYINQNQGRAIQYQWGSFICY